MTPDIVAVTYRGDLSADLLILRAEQRGASVFRFNTEDYPRRIGLDISISGSSRVSLILPNGEEVVLSGARGIWLRRPRWPTISHEVTDPLDRAFAQQESIAAMGGAWRLLADKCVSPPDALQAARWKLAQMRTASHLGLNVPDTVVTTNPGTIGDLLKRGHYVVKAVAEARVALAGEERVGQTYELRPTDALAGTRFAPVTVQRRIPKIADYRVTVVGRAVFAARLGAPADSPVDIRAVDRELVKYEAVTLDDVLEARLLRYCEEFGLRFAAFDLAEDPDGQFWFLECNPNGQWAWLEPVTGLGITSAMVGVLLGDINDH